MLHVDDFLFLALEIENSSSSIATSYFLLSTGSKLNLVIKISYYSENESLLKITKIKHLSIFLIEKILSFLLSELKDNSLKMNTGHLKTF